MKVLMFTDPHWSSYSSIVRKRGVKYSVRLENLISTMNWVEEIALKEKCECEFCLGDFYDQAHLNAEEVSALNEVEWNTLPHYFLVGNHEMGRNDLELSSTHLFNLMDNFHVIDKPIEIPINDFFSFVCLPYILNSNDYDIEKEFPYHGKNIVILSHNDLKGVQMGNFISTVGLNLDQIKRCCKLFINGHLHNSTKFDNVLNLGNLTGQNFSEDASIYKHGIIIFDTDTLTYKFIENPHALKFYKINYTGQENKFPDNSVASITTTEKYRDAALQFAKQFLESRVVVNYEVEKSEKKEFEKVDAIEQFKSSVLETIGDSDIIREELNYICN